MPRKIPHLSESEWIVANIVWQEPRITAAQVLERLPKDIRWKQKTVNTFLTRLVAKGVLGTKREGKANSYFPKIDRDSCIKAVSTSLFQKVFAGALAPMLVHFCETAPLSKEEMEKLQAILQQRKDEEKKDG